MTSLATCWRQLGRLCRGLSDWNVQGVARNDILGSADGSNASSFEQERAVAEPLDCRKVMGHEHDCLPFVAETLEGCKAFLLEILVSDCQHLVKEQDFEIDLDRNRERKSELHP